MFLSFAAGGGGGRSRLPYPEKSVGGGRDRVIMIAFISPEERFFFSSFF